MNRKAENGGRKPDRRQFCGLAATASFGAVVFGRPELTPWAGMGSQEQEQRDPNSVKTNISEALAVPRTPISTPGPHPGVVVEVHNGAVTESQSPNHGDPEVVATMLAAGMKELTGLADARDAWAKFFSAGDRVGININPVGGRLLSNTYELSEAIIAALVQVGVRKEDILIFDRFEDYMAPAGYGPGQFAGVRCIGVSYKETVDGQEVIKGEDRLDKGVYYEFDIEGRYDDEEMTQMMVNTGTRSYFTTLVTREVDKIINFPVFKNCGDFVTLCLKNHAFGTTSNCRRGHLIGNRYLAEVNAFPPLRDKTVLNIIDGLRGCWEGGPMAVAQYIWNPNRIWIATDPVAADLVGWEQIFAKRVEKELAQPGDWEGLQTKWDFLARAENLGLGVYAARPVDRRVVDLG